MRKILGLTQGVLVERVGSELLVVVPGFLDTLKLSGEAAETLQSIQAGNPVDVHTPAVSQLIDLGVVSDQRQVSRRGLIRAGAIGAGAGIAVVAMPGVAAAASPVYLEFIFFADESIDTNRFVTRLSWPFVAGSPLPPDPEPVAGTEATLRVGTHESVWTYVKPVEPYWQLKATDPSQPRLPTGDLVVGSTLTYTFNDVTYIARYKP